MIIHPFHLSARGESYTIRSAAIADAAALSQLRVQTDGETEHMDREPGEAYLDPAAFEVLIAADTAHPRRLFLTAVTQEGVIVGYSRCQGSDLKRFAHRAEFGVAVARSHWGYGIGRCLLETSITWAQETGLRKLTLSVLATNTAAIRLYEALGFETEGVLRDDRVLSDGRFYDTVLMGKRLGVERHS